MRIEILLKYSHLHTGIINDCTVKFNLRIFFYHFRSDIQKQPSDNFMILALWTHVTFLGCMYLQNQMRIAFCMRILQFVQIRCLVTIFNVSTTPVTLSCSKHEYSPSVFCLINTKSISLCLVTIPDWDLQWITFANKFSSNLNSTFLDLKFFECSLVSMFPFNATPFRFIDTIASNKFSTFSCVESKWTSSKSTGNPPALKTI